MQILVGPPFQITRPSKPYGRLLIDNWDDFGFRTTYSLIIHTETGDEIEVGQVKIARMGQEPGDRTDLPESFNRLDDSFISLSNSADYYDTLDKLGPHIRDDALETLQDAALNQAKRNQFAKEEVWRTSLLRFDLPNVPSPARSDENPASRTTESPPTAVEPILPISQSVQIRRVEQVSHDIGAHLTMDLEGLLGVAQGMIDNGTFDDPTAENAQYQMKALGEALRQADTVVGADPVVITRHATVLMGYVSAELDPDAMMREGTKVSIDASSIQAAVGQIADLAVEDDTAAATTALQIADQLDNALEPIEPNPVSRRARLRDRIPWIPTIDSAAIAEVAGMAASGTVLVPLIAAVSVGWGQ